MALIVQAMTSTDENEISTCLEYLKDAGFTGYKYQPGQVSTIRKLL